MQNENIDLSLEFSNPDVNLMILLNEMEQIIKLLQNDLLAVQSPIVTSFIQKQILHYKIIYFSLLAKDLELLKLYEPDDVKESEDGFTPM